MKIQEQIEKHVSEALTQCLEEIPRRIKSQVNIIVARALGFEHNSWGEWRVDASNGRSSIIRDLISTTVQVKVANIIQEASDSFMLDEKMMNAIIEEMKAEFRRVLILRLQEEITRLAIVGAAQIAETLMPDFSKISVDMATMANPTYGTRPIEQAALAAVVERAFEGEE